MMVSRRLQPLCVDSCSLAAASGAAEVRIEYRKNDPVASIYPQITQIFTD